MTNETLTGEYDRSFQVFQGDDEEQRTVLGTLAEGTTVKGRARSDGLTHGVTYRFWGQWVTHPKYGRQFHFSSFAVAIPLSERGMVQYITRAHHFGQGRARAIIKKYGTGSLDIIRQHPEYIVAMKIPGIGEEKVDALKAMLDGDAAKMELKAELIGLFAKRHFPHCLDEWCIRDWGAEAPDMVRRNPYTLVKYPGVGFLTTDRLYIELGLDPAAICRQGMCLWYAVYADNEGHVWFPVTVAERFLRQSITGQLKPQEALVWAIDNGRLVSRQEDGQTWIAAAGLATAEANIVSRLCAAEDGALRWPEVCGTDFEDDGELSLHQADELRKAFAGPIGILAGSPGTGKTFALAAVIRQTGGNEMRVAVCAPTGKAAVRITESLMDQGIQIIARTIHSTLGVTSSNGGVWGFEHDASNPLQHDFIFVDESSMIDVSLMSSLLAARGNAHVLFVGDPDQLSPVGPGAPFRDMIAAKVPTGRLTETRRNAGQIVESCKIVRSEHRMAWAEEIDVRTGMNLAHSEISDPTAQILEIFRQLSLASGTGAEWDPIEDVQIVTAVNEKSPLGRVPLNKILQDKINPHGQRVEGNPFWVGDKIICTRNGDVSLAAGKKGEKTRVANGELARVEEVTAKTITARLSAPVRRIRIPKGKSTEKDTGCHWQLGYAISTHKSQGSEWPVVLVMVDSYPGAVRLCDRHWLYTAISRPKAYGVTIGQVAIVQGMCTQSHMWNRKTFLREDLEELRLADMVCFWKSQLKESENGEENGGSQAAGPTAELAGNAGAQ